MPIADKLRSAGVKPKPATVKRKTLWKGPLEDGVTQSLLNRFLMCRERFRLLTVEGLQEADSFRHRLEFGSMWHICEEYHAKNESWEQPLLKYARELASRYRTQQEQVQHWYNVCKVTFPIYITYWEKHPDVKARKPMMQEVSFKVPYTLPSGRVVLLRGKWDSVDTIGKEGIYLQENKTKGDVNEAQLRRQLLFDLQTGVYLVALREELKKPIAGIRYNVIRRPLSGGAGSIRQHKPSKSNPQGETTEEFYARLAGLIKEAPDTFFMRWKVEVAPQDLVRFEREFLVPALEALCDWWEFISTHLDNPFDPAGHGIHWRLPYGIYNVIAEGGSTDLDEYLATGSEVGLQRSTNLFPEL